MMLSLEQIKNLKKKLINNPTILIKYYDFNYKLIELKGECLQIRFRGPGTSVKIKTIIAKERVIFRLNLITPFLKSIEIYSFNSIDLLWENKDNLVKES